MAMKRHHDHSNAYKVKHFTGAGLPFRGLVYYHHGVKQSSVQADRVLEKELGVHRQRGETVRHAGRSLSKEDLIFNLYNLY